MKIHTINQTIRIRMDIRRCRGAVRVGKLLNHPNALYTMLASYEVSYRLPGLLLDFDLGAIMEYSGGRNVLYITYDRSVIVKKGEISPSSYENELFQRVLLERVAMLFRLRLITGYDTTVLKEAHSYE